MADISVTITQAPDVTAVVSQAATVDAEILGVGARGDQGEQGIQGIQGIQGETGATGATGGQGDAATIMVGTVTTADPGEDADVVNSGNINEAVFDFTIPAGSTWRSGAGAPDNGVGRNGDYYFRTSNNDVYLRAAGTYSVVGNIQGAQGIQGEQGIQGIQGIPGEVTAANSPNSGEFARFTGATTIEGRTPAETRADLDLEAGTDFYSIAATDSAIDADIATHDADTTAHGATGAVVGTTNVQTLTDKRITKREVTAASYTTSVTIDSDVTDILTITAQAGALLFNNPSGTPTQGQTLIVRIKDDGTARALTYDTQFRAMGTTLPTTTVLSKTLYMLFMRNTTDTKWDLLATNQEA